MDSNPLISVIIVTINRTKELKRALKSILAQNYKPVEIIVVDNGSTDSTGDLIRNQFPQVTYLYSAENLGCPEGRNLGIRIASGDWLFFLDDDAWCEKDFLNKIVKRMQECSPQTRVVMPQIQEWINGRWENRFVTQEVVNIASFSGGVSLIHKNVFKEFGFYPDTQYGAEEKYIAVQLLTNHYQIVLDPSLVVYHKPSEHRSPRLLFQLKIINDFLWVIHFSPRWLIIPSLVIKTAQWLKKGFNKGLYCITVRGVLKGWLSLKKIFEENIRLTTHQYFSYTLIRKKAKIHYN